MNETGIQPDQPQPSHSPNLGTPASRSWLIKLLVLVGVVTIAGSLYYFFRDQLSLEYLAQRETELRNFQQAYPVWTFVIAFLIYVAVTGLSLPGAGFMTIVCGWLFRFWVALVLVSFASTTGATVAFLLSRYLFRDVIERKFGDRLKTFHEALRREGAFYLFTLRLIPAVPFFVINAGMGLTKMRVWTFWWVSQLGMLAGTCVYVFAGASIPSLSEFEGVESLPWYFWAAFIALGVFPLAAKKTIEWLRPSAIEVVREDALDVGAKFHPSQPTPENSTDYKPETNQIKPGSANDE
ncbi:MAG: TVP38/TMEM64 family protein [Gemmataceae bacterium]